MDAVRFARGAANEAGFLADLDAGLAKNKARDAAFMRAQIPVDGGGGARGLLSLKQGAQAASQAISALNGGSIVPLIGSLGSTGIAGAAVAAAAALAALTAKAFMAEDAARRVKEEFFAQVDALKAAGGNVEFAEHVNRVVSLSTAWGKAREQLDAYLATLAERTGGTNFGLGVIAAFGAAGAANTMSTETAQQREQRLAFGAAKERLEQEKKANEERQEMEKQSAAAAKEYAREREAMAQKAFEATRDRMAKEAAAQKKAADEGLERDRKIRESVRTPAQNLRRELSELGMSSVDPFTRLKALENMQQKALGMIGGGGTPRLQSQTAIRAGSVEALRANFPGGNTPDEKQLAEQKKTAENTKQAKVVLEQIRDAIKETTASMGVMP